MAQERRPAISRLLISAGVVFVFSTVACGGGEADAPTELPAEEISLDDADAPVEPSAEGITPGDADAPLELPAAEVYPGEGSAMLKIEREWDWGALGLFEMGADFTIQTLHGLVNEPEQTNKVFGSAEAEFIGTVLGYGTDGEDMVTATGPVRYDVAGFFHPASGECTFELEVTETLYLSRVTSLQSTLLGVIPLPDGLGDDVVTTFSVAFDVGSLDSFIIAGEHNSSFTLSDVVLPDATGCNFTG